MSLVSRTAFNLLFNSMSSFFIAAIIVGACITVLRIRASRMKLFLLALPFLKILWETCRGIPSHSYVFSGGDAFLIPPLGQLLYVGAGFFFTGPQFNIALAVPNAMGQPSHVPDDKKRLLA